MEDTSRYLSGRPPNSLIDPPSVWEKEFVLDELYWVATNLERMYGDYFLCRYVGTSGNSHIFRLLETLTMISSFSRGEREINTGRADSRPIRVRSPNDIDYWIQKT